MYTQKQLYKLKKPLLRVDYFMPAYDNSIVIIGMVSTGKDSLIHIDKAGKQLLRYDLQDYIHTLGMMVDTQAFILDVKNNLIIVVNLQTKQIKKYKFHYFMISQACQIQIETFLETKYICIRQNGAVNDNRLKLTYYQHPFPEKQQFPYKPIATYESQQNQWTHQYSIKKGNSHSMILWFRQRHDEQFQIRVYDLRNAVQKQGQNKGLKKTLALDNERFKIYKIKNTIGLAYNIQRVNTAVSEAWQMKKGVFCLYCTSDKTQCNARNSQGNVINTFVWDTQLATMRQINVNFDPIYNDFIIDVMSTGPYSMFRTYFFNSQGVQSSPAYFIDNLKQTIVDQQNWQCSHESKWSLAGFNDAIFIQARFDNGDVDKIELVIRYMVGKKMSSFHLLQNLPGEELDETLMHEAISLLKSDKK